MNKKTDRRVLRTREVLSKALVDLILEKGYEKITVQNIIDQANIGRSTFYDHFQDKQDLLDKSFGMLADDLDQHVQNHDHDDNVPPHHLVHSINFFQHAFDNRDFYKAMGESGGNEILMRIGRKHIKHNILTHFKNLALEESTLSIPSDLILHYVINTLWTLTTWWLEDGLKHTPEEMDAMFNGLVMPGAWQALGIHSNN